MSIKFLILSLTEDCNLRCKYCYADGGHGTQTMSLDLAKQALQLAGKSGNPFTVQFSGGEPLLALELMQEIIDYAQTEQLAAMFQVQTNGTLITAEIAKRLKAWQIGIGVSLDGRAELNDLMRPLAIGGSSTVETVRGVQHLARVDLGVGLTCVISAENAPYLDQVVELAYYLGNVQLIGFDLLRLHGRGSGLTEPTAEAVRLGVEKAFTKQQQLEQLTGKKLIFRQVEQVKWREETQTKSNFSHCYAMRGESLLVLPNGDLYPCGSLCGRDDFYLGNLSEESNKEKLLQIGQMCQNWMHPCRDCAHFSLCGGGCFARFYWANSHQYAAECSLKKSFIRKKKGEERANDKSN